MSTLAYAVRLGIRDHGAFARLVLRVRPEKPEIVQDPYAAHRKWMRLGKLGHDRPEPPESPSLLQKLLDIHLLVDLDTLAWELIPPSR